MKKVHLTFPNKLIKETVKKFLADKHKKYIVDAWKEIAKDSSLCWSPNVTNKTKDMKKVTCKKCLQYYNKL